MRTRSWINSIPAVIQQNADAFRAGSALDAAECDELVSLSRKAYANLVPLIEQRSENGFVRRCHGDLHLANIVLVDERPVLFDAIEFNEAFATIDILNDLAFTLMDLVHYRCIDAANVVLNRYLGNSTPEKSEAVALLPFPSQCARPYAQMSSSAVQPNGEPTPPWRIGQSPISRSRCWRCGQHQPARLR